ncbi:MAG: DUF1593 domain-containing protein [Prosthecobacter sp.]|uniref:nucleoside hydrolase-like domain-containing protein n=1 Tax=Prosthecobacter sp. TaxID=1965333 RepID=UPI00260ACFAA|nr:nucleoside hydrolase-like domain-containing protein [Prosthecobacter sp.]MCF7788737.1 DUF1593 domain-containing protein [Prosthecobacter sp.]
MFEIDAGGDPDDEQSLVRFLVCANEFDVAGIIANRAVAPEHENKNPVRDCLGIVRAKVIQATQHLIIATFTASPVSIFIRTPRLLSIVKKLLGDRSKRSCKLSLVLASRCRSACRVECDERIAQSAP